MRMVIWKKRIVEEGRLEEGGRGGGEKLRRKIKRGEQTVPNELRFNHKKCSNYMQRNNDICMTTVYIPLCTLTSEDIKEVDSVIYLGHVISRGDWGSLGHGVHWDTPSIRKSPTYRAHEMPFSGTPIVQEH